MSFWQNKSVLVTGAGGFTGSHLSKALVNENANVKAYVKRGSPLDKIQDILDRVELIKGDITDYASLFSEMKDVDYVFNTAAIVPVVESRGLPYSSIQVNSVGVFNVAWAARENNVKKMVHISTCHVYGNQPEDRLPLKEDTQPNPVDIYSSAKYAGEILLRQFILQESGTEFLITRAFNKFGPGQVGDWLIPRTIKQVLSKKNPKVGNPESTRDYSYISDIVDGYMRVMEFGENGDVFNLGSGKETSVKQVVDTIIELSGLDLTPNWDTQYRKADLLRSFGDCSKAKKELRWEPRIDFREGIKMTVDWWKEHPELLKM